MLPAMRRGAKARAYLLLEVQPKQTTTSESTTPATSPNETPPWQGRGVTLLCEKLSTHEIERLRGLRPLGRLSGAL